MTPENENPLSEATTDSLNEIMNRDPLDMKRADRDAIVAELRRMRAKWLVDEAAGKTRPSKAAKPKPSTLSLDDLGL